MTDNHRLSRAESSKVRESQIRVPESIVITAHISMRNQKGLSSVEALLILVIILNMGSVGCSRWEAGKSPSAASEASQIEAKQTPQQKGQPEKTDETAKQTSQQKGRPEKTVVLQKPDVPYQ
jgi:hypothetical protein